MQPQTTLVTSQMHVTGLKGPRREVMDRLNNAAFLIIERAERTGQLSVKAYGWNMGPPGPFLKSPPELIPSPQLLP